MSATDGRFDAFDALVKDRRRFVLTTHVNPDGDGLGSEIALALWLAARGKQVTILNDGRVPGNFDWLAAHFPVETFTPEKAERAFADADCVVVLDMQNKERLGKLAPYVDRPGLAVAILDHHVGDAAFGQVNVVVPEKAATGELVYDLIRREKGGLTRPIAEALYTALVTDTGSFRHSNTDPDVHTMAAELLSLGIESALIQARIHQHRHVGRLRFIGQLLQELKTTGDGKIAWFEVTPELFARYDVDGTDTEGLVDFPRTVPGVEAVLLLTDQGDGSVKASLRSSGRVDVNVVARGLGGGGHRFAAGATVPGTMAEARAKIVGALEQAVAALDPDSRPYAAPTPGTAGATR
jgi:phosphoesterase RecJ-like protein